MSSQYALMLTIAGWLSLHSTSSSLRNVSTAVRELRIDCVLITLTATVAVLPLLSSSSSAAATRRPPA